MFLTHFWCVIFLHGKKAVSDLESQLYDRSRCIVINAYIAIFEHCIMGNYIAKFPTSLLFPRHYWVDAPPLLLLYSCVKVIKLIYAKAIISYHNMRWWRLNFLYNTNFPHKRETIVTLYCLIEDMCLLFSRTAFLLDAFYCTLDDHFKDQRVYYCTLDFD